MRIRGLVDEDFIQYLKSSMFVITSYCTFKCERESGLHGICQNSPLLNSDIVEYADDEIVDRFLNNPLTEAVVIGGLEPFDQFNELLALIKAFREKTLCDIVIYTGYNAEELEEEIKTLQRSTVNIIIKFGRYIPTGPSKFDPVLGVTLASDNQYAKKIC